MFLFDDSPNDVWLDACTFCNGEVMMTPRRELLLGRMCDECSVFCGLETASETDDEFDIE